MNELPLTPERRARLDVAIREGLRMLIQDVWHLRDRHEAVGPCFERIYESCADLDSILSAFPREDDFVAFQRLAEQARNGEPLDITKPRRPRPEPE